MADDFGLKEKLEEVKLALLNKFDSINLGSTKPEILVRDYAQNLRLDRKLQYLLSIVEDLRSASIEDFAFTRQDGILFSTTNDLIDLVKIFDLGVSYETKLFDMGMYLCSELIRLSNEATQKVDDSITPRVLRRLFVERMGKAMGPITFSIDNGYSLETITGYFKFGVEQSNQFLADAKKCCYVDYPNCVKGDLHDELINKYIEGYELGILEFDNILPLNKHIENWDFNMGLIRDSIKLWINERSVMSRKDSYVNYLQAIGRYRSEIRIFSGECRDNVTLTRAVTLALDAIDFAKKYEDRLVCWAPNHMVEFKGEALRCYNLLTMKTDSITQRINKYLI